MSRTFVCLTLSAGLMLVAMQQASAADALPRLNLDLARTTVAGLSSGAYMAGQVHLAFSEHVQGAAILAGGPYGCAQGRLELATQRCMAVQLGPPDAAALLALARTRADAGELAPLANLADDRVYVFSGTLDRTVLPEVAAQVQAFYVGAGLPPSAVRFEAGLAAGHGFAVLDGPVACAVTGPPFVNDCDLDQAGELLAFLTGPMQPPAAATPAPVAFDQRHYQPSPGPRGMAATGYIYVPAACAAGEACRAHVVFHGCKQSAEQVGDAVTAGAGFNRWAETNRIVVLYPQAAATWSNPNGCWDWWGYTGAAYATRKGAQPAAVRRMLLALAGASDTEPERCRRHDGWNLAHWQANRAIACGWGLAWACAAGSGEPLGLLIGGAATLYEHPDGFFTPEPCEG